MADAQALLIFQGDHTNAIPAKFYEYLLTGKPVLTVVQDGALKDICLDTGCGIVVDPASEPVAMARAIEEVLNRKPRSVEEIARVAASYNFKNLTAKLAEHLHCFLAAEAPYTTLPNLR
jgi:glycosyltransferase involved in cell wall biosynthesis